MSEIEDKQWSVYVHTFPNGKKYVGITSQNPRLRWRLDGSGYKNQPYVSNAIEKYGWQNIQHEIVLETRDQNEAFKMEQELIAQNRTNEKVFGYNLSSGGEAGSFGVKWTEERKKRYRENHSGVNHPRFGKKFSKEQIERLKKSRNMRETSPLSIEAQNRSAKSMRRRVICVETGEEFDSMHAAADKYHVSAGAISVACAQYPVRTSAGYHWKEKEKEYGDVQVDYLEKYNTKRKKPVMCEELGAKYQSISRAARETGIDARHISRCCRLTRKTAGGYHWSYINEDEEDYFVA